MVREIMRDEAFLKIPSRPATPGDVAVADDLLDTLRAHRDGCVGMAANMIGVKKRIIIVNASGNDIVMYNPVILRKEQKENCLFKKNMEKHLMV